MIHKIQAVMIRDFKECIQNMGLLTSLFLPVIMALMFMRMETEIGSDVPTFMFYVVIGITFASVMASIIMSLLAEENEHHTMDQFIRTKSDLLANLIGKSILLSIVTAAIILFNIIIFNQLDVLDWRDMTGLVLLGLFFLLISLGFGLISKTLAGTSIYILVVLFLFAMAPYVDFLFSSNIQNVFAYSPVYQNIQIHSGAFSEPVLILFGWIFLGFVFFLFAFNKKAKSL